MLAYIKRWWSKTPSPKGNPLLEPGPHVTYVSALYAGLAQHCTYDVLHAQSHVLELYYPNAQTYKKELFRIVEWMRQDLDVKTLAEYKVGVIRVDDWYIDTDGTDIPVGKWVVDIHLGWKLFNEQLERIKKADELSAQYYLRRAASLLDDGVRVGTYLRDKT